jgi:signal transduction histidine kinase/ActR/RegA family two-component response regulator
MKHILNQEATVFGTVETPEDSDCWHPDDNLFVRMNDENGNFIGVISVDDSKSGNRPNDDIVRPLEIFSSLISQIIVLKREFEKRRELEEQLRQAQKMEAIGNLTGGIAHDFNNILGVIIGNSEIAMLDLPQESESYQSFEEIKTAAIRARDIVRQLLSFSRKSVRVCEPMLLQKVLEESLTFMRSTIPSSIQINRELGEEKIVIDGDPTGIYQIMVNLCTNAAQAMEDEGGVLTITLDSINASLAGVDEKQFPDSGKFARITVADTGKGIPEENVHQIFDPYFTTKDIGKGTGIGLSVVHGIVKGHNGVISVDSTPGEGTAFTLLLPMIPDLAEADVSGTETSATPGEGRILLVDDEPSLLEINRKMLEHCGYLVDSFTNPIDCLDAFRQSPNSYNLVITDFTMPHMTGDLLTKKILSIDPDMPVILCTGFEDKIDEQQALDLGIRHYLRKPLAMQELAGKVTHTIGKK